MGGRLGQRENFHIGIPGEGKIVISVYAKRIIFRKKRVQKRKTILPPTGIAG